MTTSEYNNLKLIRFAENLIGLTIVPFMGFWFFKYRNGPANIKMYGLIGYFAFYGGGTNLFKYMDKN